MLNLYIDFDGVILDTITTFNRIMKEMNVDVESTKEDKSFYRNLDWSKVIAITPEINDSIACLQKLIDSNKYDLAILTHINSIDEIIEKVKFIREHFGNITIIPVPKAISKTKMVHAKGAILVDDYSGNLREWEAAGGIGIRFSTTLESKGFKVIDRLDQLLDIKIQGEQHGATR